MERIIWAPWKAEYSEKLNELVGRWTSARATTLDTAKANTDTLLARITTTLISTINAMATKVNTNLDVAVSTMGGANPSVRRGEYTIPAGASTVDVTITAIPNVNKAYLLPPQHHNYPDQAVDGYIVNATTVRFQRSSITGSLAGRYVVVYWS